MKKQIVIANTICCLGLLLNILPIHASSPNDELIWKMPTYSNSQGNALDKFYEHKSREDQVDLTEKSLEAKTFEMCAGIKDASIASACFNALAQQKQLDALKDITNQVIENDNDKDRRNKIINGLIVGGTVGLKIFGKGLGIDL